MVTSFVKQVSRSSTIKFNFTSFLISKSMDSFHKSVLQLYDLELYFQRQMVCSSEKYTRVEYVC